jgi:hypothetical protein
VAQYRSLRARDEALDAMFQALSKNAPGAETNRGDGAESPVAAVAQSLS